MPKVSKTTGTTKKTTKTNGAATNAPATASMASGAPAAATGGNGDARKSNTTTMPSRPRPSAEELHEAIRQRAYEIYCERGQQGGNPEDDWQQAEREILGRYGKIA